MDNNFNGSDYNGNLSDYDGQYYDPYSYGQNMGYENIDPYGQNMQYGQVDGQYIQPESQYEQPGYQYGQPVMQQPIIIQQPMQQESGVSCPTCGSHNLHLIQEQHTSGSDYSAFDGLCGFILFGPVGLLCGLCSDGKQTHTDSYWVCRNCGKKFKV